MERPRRLGAYLDHAATTPMREEAIDAMLPFLDGEFANPSSVYSTGRRARRAIDDARDEIAAFCGCEPGEVVFTSGGTEADNLAILGVAAMAPGGVVTTAVEHDAVLAPARRSRARVVPVSADGAVDLGALEEALGDDVALVSVMAVNNELGRVEPIAEVAETVRRLAPEALVHSDAVQAAPWFDLALMLTECDLISVSAHKIGGPKGVGALVVRSRVRGRMLPLAVGGGQERALRPGTENVAGIVAMAAAARATRSSLGPDGARTAARRDRFCDGILATVPCAQESIPRALSAPGFCHLRFRGVLAEELLVLLDEGGVAASAGSACSSGALSPSHVLTACGWERGAAREAIRFTLGPQTTDEEVDHALGVVPGAVERLSSTAPVGG